MRRNFLFLFILFCSANAFAQNPYEQFGVEGRFLQAEYENSGENFHKITFEDSSSEVYQLEFDFKNFTYEVSYGSGNIVSAGKLSLTKPKRFFSRDPMQAKFVSYSPYNFAGLSPIYFTDSLGLAPSGSRMFRSNAYLRGDEKAAQTVLNAEIGAAKMLFEDFKVLTTGEDFNQNQSSRVAAGVFILLDITPIGKISKATKPIFKVVKAGSKGKKVGRFANKALELEHFDKHANEFAGKFRNVKEYTKSAQNFFKREGDGIYEYNRHGGTLVKYDVNNNILGIMKKDGTIRTFFKPEEGYKDFINDVQKHLGNEAAETMEKTIKENL